MVLRWPAPTPTPTRTLTRAERDALYPVEDDEPMTTSFAHCEAFTYALAAVRDHLRDADCLVAGDFAVYYRPLSAGASGPAPSVVPDLLVAFNVTLERNTSYCLWEVGKMPELVMEMASKSTWAVDQEYKSDLYAELGVQEYWQYDPHGDYLTPRLRGQRLEDGVYQPIPERRRPDLDADLFPSAVLGTFWGCPRATGDLRLWNPKERTWYLPQAEAEARRAEAQARQAAEAQAQAAAQRAEAAEAEARAEAQARRAAEAEAQAEAEARRAAEAEVQAEAEARRAEAQARQAAEAEVARLRAYLDTLRKSP